MSDSPNWAQLGKVDQLQMGLPDFVALNWWTGEVPCEANRYYEPNCTLRLRRRRTDVLYANC